MRVRDESVSAKIKEEKCQQFFSYAKLKNPAYFFQQKIRQFVKLGFGGAVGFSLIAFYRGEPEFYSQVRLSC